MKSLNRYAEKKSPDVKVMVDFLARTKAELWTWHDSLHEGLRVDSSAPSTPYVPAVLQLQYVEAQKTALKEI
jgi:hypothetical protein